MYHVFNFKHDVYNYEKVYVTLKRGTDLFGSV